MDDDEDDIFSMLLKENKSKTKKAKQMRHTKTRSVPSVGDVDSDENDEDVPFDLKFSIDDSLPRSFKKSEAESHVFEHVYEQDWIVLDHCCDENFCYVLIDSNGTAVVQIYHLDCDKTKQPKLAMHLSTPMSSALFDDRDKPEHRHLYIINQHSSPTTCDARNTDLSLESGNVDLPPTTFASLFGKTTSLVKSPVIVLCSNDGCVYWRPVKSVREEQKFYLMCHLVDLANSIVLVSVKIKPAIDEEVAKSLQSALMMTDNAAGDGHAYGLLVANRIGDCCLLLPTPRRTSGSGCGEQLPLRFCVPHPIVCCINGKQQFIYSTGWSVESVRLCLRQDENLPSITLENCSTLKMANIGRLFFKTTHIDSGPQLMGLTSDMDAIHIPTQSTSETAATATHILPQTIQHIQQHASSIQQLQGRSQALDSCLTQLNVFATLRQQNQKKNLGRDINLSPLIHCKCFVDHSQGYSKTSEIRIQLRNDSRIDLSNQWSVLVTAFRESSSSEDNNFADSFCFKMETGFHSNRLKTFPVPLSDGLCSDPLSTLRVNVSLILCVTRDVCQNSVISFPCVNQDTVLEVEIYSQVFDYLHFLRVSSDSDLSSMKKTNYSIADMGTFLDRLREKRLKRKSQGDEIIPGKENYLSKIPVSHLIDQKSRSEPTEDALRLLLPNICKVSEDNSNSPLSLMCQSLTGAEICFTVEKTEVATETDKLSVQLRLESHDIILLCVIHIALFERFQNMENYTVQASPSKMEKQISELKAIRSCLSKKSAESKLGEMASSLCKVLDCLGKCIE